jgi:putative transposase
MSGRGKCWDKAPTERVIRSFKREWMPRTGYQSLVDAKKDIGHYLMEYYNGYRPHQNNSGLSPILTEEKLNYVSGMT